MLAAVGASIAPHRRSRRHARPHRRRGVVVAVKSIAALARNMAKIALRIGVLATACGRASAWHIRRAIGAGRGDLRGIVINAIIAWRLAEIVMNDPYNERREMAREWHLHHKIPDHFFMFAENEEVQIAMKPPLLARHMRGGSNKNAAIAWPVAWRIMSLPEHFGRRRIS